MDVKIKSNWKKKSGGEKHQSYAFVEDADTIDISTSEDTKFRIRHIGGALVITKTDSDDAAISIRPSVSNQIVIN